MFILAAIIFRFSSVPNKIDLDQMANEEAGSAEKVVHKKSVFGYPQLVMGMIGIFVYVGVEVATASNLPAFLQKDLNITTDKVAPFISLYWASLMMGRWASSVGAFKLGEGAKKVLQFFMPYIAFGVFLLVNVIANHDVTPFYYYPFVIIAMIAGTILSKGNPARLLLIFSALGITALFIGMLSSGIVSAYAFMSVGLFCSTLWPCIFTLAIAGLGRHTNEGASFLVMMIMGGGVVSLIQGYLADNVVGIQWSYLVGVACFIYLAYYAIRAKAVLKAQGIDYDQLEAAGGH